MDMPATKSDLPQMIYSLTAFGSEGNRAMVSRLYNFLDGGCTDLERDVATDLLLYCQGDELGPLGDQPFDLTKRNCLERLKAKG